MHVLRFIFKFQMYQDVIEKWTLEMKISGFDHQRWMKSMGMLFDYWDSLTITRHRDISVKKLKSHNLENLHSSIIKLISLS